MARDVSGARVLVGTEVSLRTSLRSDIGVVRVRNEDAAYIDPGERYFVLADGMGGRGGGDIASAMAIEVVRSVLDAAADELDGFAATPDPAGRRRVRALITRAVEEANERIRSRGLADPALRGMGTTLEVAVIVARELFVAHVGDSRTYLVRDGRAELLTTDHTLAESMRTSGRLSDADAESSPMRAVLTNAIGFRARVVIEHQHHELRDGDRLLLCSDGLYEHFSTGELGAAMRQPWIDDGLAELVAIARARGGNDNITGIAVELPSHDSDRVDALEYLRLDTARAELLEDLEHDTALAFVERAFADLE